MDPRIDPYEPRAEIKRLKEKILELIRDSKESKERIKILEQKVSESQINSIVQRLDDIENRMNQESKSDEIENNHFVSENCLYIYCKTSNYYFI